VGDVVVDNYVLRVGVRQPLFTGFRLTGASDAAEFQAEASELDFARTQEHVEYGILVAYWSLYQAREVLRSAEENVKRLESYRRDTERLMQAGLMTRNDQLKVEVQFSNARIAELEARDASRLAEMDLNILLGLASDTPIELSSRPGEISPKNSLIEGTSLSRLVETASSKRRDLEAASMRVESAHAGLRAAKGGWWPQIEFTANYLYNNPNTRYQPITPEFLGTWDVGVSLFLELWNWGATASRVEQAKAKLQQAELVRLELHEAMSLEVHRAALAIRRAKEKVTLANLALSQSDENLRSEADKYTSGLASSTDLLEAEVTLVNAETQLSGSLVEYALSVAALDRAIGSARMRGMDNQ
jgi:outer membrane protein TolC